MAEPWERFMCIDAAKLKQFPIPAEQPLELTRLIQTEADARSALLPEKICYAGVPTRAALSDAREKADVHLARMIALQEELDWECYRLYGIIDENMTAAPDQVPALELGQRTFEIRMAREIQEGGLKTSWFERHRSRPVTEFPSHWPEAYRRLCLQRLALTQENREVGLIERPAFKRRWNIPTWEEMEQAALKNWLLDRMEANASWHGHALVSCSQLRDALAQDKDWASVAAICSGGAVENLDGLVAQLAVGEAVPFLPVLRYTETGLRKRAEWEQVFGAGKSHFTLEDRNLAAIARHRILKPKSDTARLQIKQAFEKVRREPESVRDVLLTSESNIEEFEQLYPFSPALVKTLVVVSSALQRERTALKIMMQLLVENQDTMRLGELVPVPAGIACF